MLLDLTFYSIDILTHQQQTVFENIVGKEEIARDEQFLLIPQCFLLNQKLVSPFVNIYDITLFMTSHYFFFLLLNWKSLKLTYEAKG